MKKYIVLVNSESLINRDVIVRYLYIRKLVFLEVKWFGYNEIDKIFG